MGLAGCGKNPPRLSFRGAQGDEESRISFNFRARFLAKSTLSSFAALRTVRNGGANGLGMTRSRTFFHTLLDKTGLASPTVRW